MANYHAPRLVPLNLAIASAACAPQPIAEPDPHQECADRGGLYMYGLDKWGVPDFCLTPATGDLVDFAEATVDSWVTWAENGGVNQLIGCYLKPHDCGILPYIETPQCPTGCIL